MNCNTVMSFSNLTDLSLEEKWGIFLRRSGHTLGYFAEKIGITTPTLSRRLRSTTIPTKQYNTLVELGVPPELLPEPRDVKRGPKPKGNFPPRADEL